MSQVYASEPQCTGRVVFETTHGPLDVQLFCRECPLFTRLFLQLCVDGFYDFMVFHRIQPKFVIQTGLVRQNQQRGEEDGAAGGAVEDEKRMKEYLARMDADRVLERRRYETNTRLRFSHRGLVAMALGVDDDPDYGVLPQFFVTLDEAAFLDGKNVIFGTVANGPTVFNALRIGGVDVDSETNQPTDMQQAPRITSTRIVDNPIHTTIVAQPTVPWRKATAVEGEKAGKKKKKKRKGKLDVNVLSFGDEMGDAEELQKSANNSAAAAAAFDEGEGEDSAAVTDEPAAAGSKNINKSVSPPAEASNGDAKRPPSEPVDKQAESGDDAGGRTDQGAPATKEAGEETDEKKNKDKTSREKRDKEDHGRSSLVEMRKAKYTKGRKKDKRQREADTMNRLMAFQSKVKESVASAKSASGSGTGQQKADDSLAARMARRAAKAEGGGEDDGADDPGYHGQVLEDDDGQGGDDGGSDWLRTKFRCRRHVDHGAGSGGAGASGSDGRHMDDYEVVDDSRRSGRSSRDGGRREGGGGDRHRHHHHKRHKGNGHHQHRRDRDDGGDHRAQHRR